MAGVPASNLYGSSLGLNVAQVHAPDHVAAAHERRHGLQQFLRGPTARRCRSGRTSCAPEKARKSAPRVCTSTGKCGTLCARVHQHQRAGRVRAGRHLGDRVDRAQHVGHVGDAHQLGLAASAARPDTARSSSPLVGHRHDFESARRSRRPASARAPGWSGAPSRCRRSRRRPGCWRGPSCRPPG